VRLLALIGVLSCIAFWHAQPASAQGELPGATGRLVVRAVQGTAGGTALSGDAVEIELLHQGQTVQTLDATLDAAGQAVLDQIRVGVEVRSLVRITHGGVQYQQAGPLMDTAHADESVDVTVYDVTESEPAWRVSSRQVTVDPKGAWVTVSETVVAENPGDMTWIGGRPDAEGRQTTVRLAIPATAQDIRLDLGFAGWRFAAFEDGTLRVQMPLMPGQTTYRFAYRVPVTDGRVEVSLSSPMPTARMVVYVPEDANVQASGLSPVGTRTGESGTYTLFEGGGLGASVSAGVTLAGLTPAVTTVAPAPGKSNSMSPMVVGLGTVLGILVVGAVVALAVRGRETPG